MTHSSKNAIENGQPVKNLLNKYKKNFEALDKIDTDIPIKLTYPIGAKAMSGDGVYFS